MTNDEWNECENALEMLSALETTLSRESHIALQPLLWRYLLACCDKISELISQSALQDGLRGAEQYLDGEIDHDELNRLNRHAEAECFSLEYDGVTIRGESPIVNVCNVSGQTRAEALDTVTRAAFFANRAMMGIIPGKRSVRYSDFCCPKLLRKFIPMPFDH